MVRLSFRHRALPHQYQDILSLQLFLASLPLHGKMAVSSMEKSLMDTAPWESNADPPTSRERDGNKRSTKLARSHLSGHRIRRKCAITPPDPFPGEVLRQGCGRHSRPQVPQSPPPQQIEPGFYLALLPHSGIAFAYRHHCNIRRHSNYEVPQTFFLVSEHGGGQEDERQCRDRVQW